MFAETTALHREVAALLDPRAAPEGFLDWLGAWFDMRFAAQIPVATRREMIAGALPHFRRRGTVAGLRQVLRWHLGLHDPMPQVIEHFRLPDGPVTIGAVDLAPGPRAHAFTVVLPAQALPDAETRGRVERLIAASIPAHARWQICPVRPRLTVARQSTIGVDTLLGSLDPGPLGAVDAGQSFTTPGPASPDMSGADPAGRRQPPCPTTS